MRRSTISEIMTAGKTLCASIRRYQERTRRGTSIGSSPSLVNAPTMDRPGADPRSHSKSGAYNRETFVRRAHLKFCSMFTRNTRLIRDLIAEARKAYKAASEHLINVYVAERYILLLFHLSSEST